MIGIDGATWEIITPWAEEGNLPTFKLMMENGAWGKLKSTIPPISPAAWTSIYTGLKPTKHSIWSFVKKKDNSYFIRPISSRDNKGKPLWKILTENGIRSVFLNIPFAYPPAKFNGILTTGLGTPSRNSHFSYPMNIKEEIFRSIPDYNVDFYEEKILRSKNKSFIVNEVFRITKSHIKAFKHFYRQEKELSRVFSITLRSLDVIQHYFQDSKEIVLRFYKQIDNFLNWCIENKEEDDVLLVCSDHGFRRVDKKVYINEWLKKEGLLKEHPRERFFLRKLLPYTESLHKLLLVLNFRELIWKIKRSKHLEKLMKIFPSKKISYFIKIWWEETSAYLLEASFGIIQLNLKGREVTGKVFKENYDEIRERIINNLFRVKDPETGNLVFEFVKKGEEIYGDLEQSPDIIAYPKNGYLISGGFSDSGNLFEIETERNGDHSIEGILCVFNAHMGIGALNEEISVWDIPAIVMNSLGIMVPNYFDGKVPNSLLKWGYHTHENK